MNSPSIASLLPNSLLAVLVIAFMICAVVIYALYSHGIVHVRFSRGKTMFQLDAEGRNSERR